MKKLSIKKMFVGAMVASTAGMASLGLLANAAHADTATDGQNFAPVLYQGTTEVVYQGYLIANGFRFTPGATVEVWVQNNTTGEQDVRYTQADSSGNISAGFSNDDALTCGDGYDIWAIDESTWLSSNDVLGSDYCGTS